MNTLLYTTAFGDPIFLKMAENMIASARANGYAGQARILGDRECLPGLPKAGLLRALSREELESYTKILFVDSDCIFVRDPGLMFENAGLSFVVEGDSLNFYNSIFLDDEEKMLPEKRLNSGAFLMPGEKAWDFLGAWEHLWLEAPRDEAKSNPHLSWVPEGMMDQAALQALVMRRKISYTPLLGMRFPLAESVPYEDGVLLHFCGDLNQGGHLQNKRAAWEYMRAFSFQGKSGSEIA